jgi:hypothetical protein
VSTRSSRMRSVQFYIDVDVDEDLQRTVTAYLQEGLTISRSVILREGLVIGLERNQERLAAYRKNINEDADEV